MLHDSYKAQLAAERTFSNPGAGRLPTNAEAAQPKEPVQTMEGTLSGVLDQFGLTEFAPDMLQGLAEIDPDLFFAAALARLEIEGGSPGYRKRSLRLLDSPAFLLSLVQAKRFTTVELKDLCARYAREEPLLDVKLARLLPGRMSDSHHLGTSDILRVLEVLDAISRGPRLLTIIDHLTRSTDRHVASKAALLVGRRLQSRQWIGRHLSATDPRVRASVAEALWGVDSSLATETLRNCLDDENNRVRGNAIVGLHMIGDRRVGWHINVLAKDGRPEYRQTAAWVIGKMEEPEFAHLLDGLLQDEDQGVCRTAENALKRLREVALMRLRPIPASE